MGAGQTFRRWRQWRASAASRFAVLMFAVLLLGGVLPAPAQPTPVRTADRACRRCHQRIYDQYLQTPMAHASGEAADKLMPGTLSHAGVEYTIAEVGGHPTLSWRSAAAPAASGPAMRLTYFLGSGHLGVTWLYSIGDYLFESPVAWYAASHGLDMKPGLAEATSMPPALPMESACLRCHMSAVQASENGSVNRYSADPFLHTGITCESCHGDTARHVATAGSAPVVNPASLDAERRDSVCISCHLEGDVSVERAGRSGLEYKPGDRIADDLSYFVFAGKDLTTRGVSQVEQFSQSRCRQASGERMSCTSCHDPHFTPAASQKVAFFRAKCLACHKGASFAATHHPENPDCVGCHMPHNSAENIPHVAWTDHRILRTPGSAPSPQRIPPDRLVPIFSPAATDRDLAMAWYLALMQGDRAAEPQAWQRLLAQKDEIRNDSAALDALGILSVERGSLPQAQALFQRVLTLDPRDLTALTNGATLAARSGKLDEATVMLRTVFARNEDVVGLAMNLARVECAQGDAPGVRDTLHSALRFNPGDPQLQRFLEHAQACGAPQKAAW